MRSHNGDNVAYHGDDDGGDIDDIEDDDYVKTFAANDVWGFSMRSHKQIWYFTNLPVPKSSSTWTFVLKFAYLYLSNS